MTAEALRTHPGNLEKAGVVLVGAGGLEAIVTGFGNRIDIAAIGLGTVVLGRGIVFLADRRAERAQRSIPPKAVGT